MKPLFVRIGPKTGPEKFFRCGMEFGRAWSRVDVDQATAKRLHAEQMLEVTGEQPEDFVEPQADASTGIAAGAPLPQGTGKQAAKTK